MKLTRGAKPAAMLAFAIIALAWADDPSTTVQKPVTRDPRKAADLLFHDIMQTLPGEAKAQVDSAGRTRPTGPAQAKGLDSTVPGCGDQKQPMADALKELPDQLRNQVEKAIAEMEQRNVQRAIEFREHRRGMKAPQQP